MELNSKPLAIVAGASREYSVPPEVLLSRWYQESGMRLGGDQGGAGGYDALAQIVRKQTEISERHRAHRFVANERDMLAICEHCGYNCSAIQGSSTGALGPMQFQPSTWVLGAVDADGDGKACPLDLADAMYTAARKLKGDYDRTGSWNGAILAYAGGDGERNRAYVRRAQPLLHFFHKFWAEHFGG
jgi:membrane-bound lytic murein transglycosylase B